MPMTRWLAPAVKINGAVRVGVTGDSHEDVLSRLPNYPRSTFDRTVAKGFVNETGDFLSRAEAFKYAKRHRLLNDAVIEGEDELHSEHLS